MRKTAREISRSAAGRARMPDRDYYTSRPRHERQAREYIAHVTKMLTLLGEPAEKATDDAKKVMVLETKLAEASRTRVQLRDPVKNYNKMGVRQLQALPPDWNGAITSRRSAWSIPAMSTCSSPEFFKAAINLFKSTSIDDWKAYLRCTDQCDRVISFDRFRQRGI